MAVVARRRAVAAVRAYSLKAGPRVAAESALAAVEWADGTTHGTVNVDVVQARQLIDQLIRFIEEATGWERQRNRMQQQPLPGNGVVHQDDTPLPIDRHSPGPELSEKPSPSSPAPGVFVTRGVSST